MLWVNYGEVCMPSEFTKRVITIIKSIPEGNITGYGQIAAMAGSPQAARQVVRILNTCSRSENLPWWRVVNKSGIISLQCEGFAEQKARLEEEGVVVSDDGAIDLAKYGWLP